MTQKEQIIEIDNLIEQQYTDRDYNELQALSKLFNESFLTDLEAILNINSRSETNYKDRFEISCGWIDKIPLAKFVNPVKDINGNIITGKTELGDLLLIYSYNKKSINKSGDIIIPEKRAVILQAKIANKPVPFIPIGQILTNRVNPTSKELALLSSWPEFDLYKTSRAKKPILNNIKLDSSEANAKFIGYFRKKWSVGKPINKEACEASIGSLIVDMIAGYEGQAFDISSLKDWDTLIKTILEICGDYNLPKSLFGSSESSRFKNIIRSPLMLFFFFGRSLINTRRFPILFITRMVEEGE